MTRLERLHAERTRLANEIRALADRQASWTSSDRQQWDSTNAAYDECMSDIRAEEGSASNGRNQHPLAHLIGRDPIDALERGPQNPAAFGGSQRGSDSDLALAGWIRSAHGVAAHRDEWEAASRMGLHPQASLIELRLPAQRPGPFALSSQTGSSGGFTIPSGFMGSLAASMRAVSGVLQTCETMITDDGREMPWPTLHDADNDDAALIGEGVAADESDLTFGATKFRAYKVNSGLLKAPHELLRDSGVDMVSTIGTALGERLGRKSNALWTTGSGSATPNGIVTGSALGVTAASATAITMDELIELQHSVDPAYRQSAGFMLHDDVASHIRRLKDGDGNYLWQSSNQAGQPALLLGSPVTINNSMASTIESGAKSVLFGQLSSYKVRIVVGIRFRQLNERFAESDQVGFISFIEIDGAVLNPSGAATLCPIKHLLHP